MTIIRKTWLAMAAVLLSPLAAQAVPIDYQIDFGAAFLSSGAASPITGGTGNFTWDDDTQLVSNLTWDFGSGLTGGANPDWTFVFSGTTLSQFFFEIVTATDVSPGNCSEPGGACGLGFTAGNGLYGWPGSQIDFSINGDNSMSYFLVDPDDGLLLGSFTTRLVSVPEPGTLALLGLGLVAIGVTRRRRRS